MGYSNYKKLHQVKSKFGLKVVSTNLFADANIQSIPVSEWLRISLERAYNTPPTNEKSKSERLVSPVLLEVSDVFKNDISFFSGEDLSINPDDDLAGPCDFFFALTPPTIVIDSPIISVVEAKDEDLEWGLAQCAAQIYAAHLFNERDNKDLPVLYGCATTGSEWQFFKLENNTLYIDRMPKNDLPQVLGTWHWILNYYVTNFIK
jgi:hypothetical protein